MNPRVKSALVSRQHTIKQVMETIQAQPHANPPGPGHIALMTDSNQRLLGVITDGDIRRAILAGIKLSAPVAKIIKRQPIVFDASLSPDEILTQTIQIVNEKKLPGRRLEYIILVDKQHRVEDVFSFFELWQKAEIKTRTFAVVGLGYVGLTLGLVLAEAGYKVIGIDVRKSVVEALSNYRTHVWEKDVVPLLRKHLATNLVVQHDFRNEINDVYIICVGTPLNKSGAADTKPLKLALDKITKKLKTGDLVILRSTVPIGTCRNFVIPALEKSSNLVAGQDFYLAFAPERTVEGNAIEELKILPQIIGGLNKKSTELAVKVFENITDNIVIVENLEAAETIKLLNNTYRDMTFAFANEISVMAKKLGLDTHKLIRAANQGYSRSAIPLPSPGVGGPCLTKDPYILSQSARRLGIAIALPQAARKTNESMTAEIANRVTTFLEVAGKPADQVKIFVAGLAFKGRPETGDMRASTNLQIAQLLKKRFQKVYAFDPLVPRKKINLEKIIYQKPEQGFKKADCVLILTNHQDFVAWDIQKLARSMNKPSLLFDAWHLYDGRMKKPPKGVTYQAL